MTSFTVEDMLAKRIEELEDAHNELFVMFTMYRKVLEDIVLLVRTSELTEAKETMSSACRMAEDVLRDVGASVK